MKENNLNNANNLIAKILNGLENYGDFIIFSLLIYLKLYNFNLQVASFSNLFYLSSIGLILILLGISLLFSYKKRIAFLYSLNLIITFVIMADLLFFRYYHDVISIPILLQIAQAGSVKNSMLALYQTKDIYFWLDLVILLPIVAVLLFKGKISFKLPPKQVYQRFFLLFILGASLISYTFYGIEQKMGKRIFVNILDQTFFVNQMGIINYHFFDLGKYAQKKISKTKILEEDYYKVKNTFLNNKIEKNKYTGVAKDKNLIIIQIEAFQQFVINEKINGQEVTPNLNKLIKDNLYFDNFYYQTAQGNTSDAEFLTNTSFYPAKEGSAYFQYTSNNFVSLPKLLKEKNYDASVFHAYKSSYWNRTTMYQALGFDKFYSKEDFKEGTQVGWGLGDQDFLQQTADILEQKKNPFYAFVITLSSHYPFEAFEEMKDLDVGEYEGTFTGRYLKAAHYTDAAFGNFVERLKANGLWDKSVVVFYGDHNAFTTIEKADLLKYKEIEDTTLNWGSLQKVPMIMHIPNVEAKGTISKAAGQINIMPTVLNLLGISNNYMLGQDLNSPKYDPFVIFRGGSFTDGKIHYFADSQELYSIKDKKILPLKDYENKIKKAQERLSISDLVLEHNIYPEQDIKK